MKFDLMDIFIFHDFNEEQCDNSEKRELSFFLNKANIQHTKYGDTTILTHIAFKANEKITIKQTNGNNT